MDRGTDGWIGWVDGWMDGWMDGWVGKGTTKRSKHLRVLFSPKAKQEKRQNTNNNDSTSNNGRQQQSIEPAASCSL